MTTLYPCYEIDNQKTGLLTLNTVNNKKLYLMYEIGKQSINMILNYIFNEFKYKCDQYNKLSDFKFTIGDKPLELSDDPIKSNLILGNNPVVRMGLKHYDSYCKPIPNIKYQPEKFPLDSNENTISVFVKQLTGKMIHLNLNPNEVTVYELMMRICDLEGVPVDQQRIIYGGKQLEHENLLAVYGVQNERTFQLVLRLRGGMYNEVSGRNGEYEPLQSVLIDLTGKY